MNLLNIQPCLNPKQCQASAASLNYQVQYMTRKLRKAKVELVEYPIEV